MKKKRLNDSFSDWLTGGGIFSVLQNFPVPWASEDIASELDITYHGNISGNKPISPMVDKIQTGDSLTDSEKMLLATTIVAVYGDNWGKQWETLSYDYNPIENYSMTETMEDDTTVHTYGKSTTRTDNLSHTKTGTEALGLDETDTRTDNLTHTKTGTEALGLNETETRTDNLTHTKTGTDTRTDNLTDTTTPNLTSSTSNSVHGFNSTDPVPSGEQTTTQTGTQTVTHTGTSATGYNTTEKDTGSVETTKRGTDTTTYNTTDKDTGTVENRKRGTDTTTYNTTDSDTGTQTLADNGEDTDTRNYTLTRSGNIGVTTSQQMIESQRNLLMWNFFYDVVFPDVNKFLTLQIY